jgi:hypothetical protein
LEEDLFQTAALYCSAGDCPTRSPHLPRKRRMPEINSTLNCGKVCLTRRSSESVADGQT